MKKLKLTEEDKGFLRELIAKLIMFLIVDMLITLVFVAAGLLVGIPALGAVLGSAGGPIGAFLACKYIDNGGV